MSSTARALSIVVMALVAFVSASLASGAARHFGSQAFPLAFSAVVLIATVGLALSNRLTLPLVGTGIVVTILGNFAIVSIGFGFF